MKLHQVPLDAIDPPAHEHRLDINPADLSDLADSIQDNGLLHPIHVRQDGERYEIIHGHRRYLAHKILHAGSIAAFIVPFQDAQRVEQQRFAENFHRTDLTPMEEGLALKRALHEGHFAIEDLARTMRRSKDWIRERIALLELPDELQRALHARTLATTAALALAEVGDALHRAYLLAYATESGATVPIIRSWVAEYLQQKAAAGMQALPPPDTSQPPTSARVLLRCAVCDAEHDHTELVIARICQPCISTIRQT